MLFYGGGREGCVQSAAYILQIWLFSLCKLLIYSKKPPGERSEGSFVGEKKGIFNIIRASHANMQLLLPALLPGCAVQYRIRSPLH